MTGERHHSTFTREVPQVENVYELVVVASLRARQLNEFQMHVPVDSQINPVEEALKETFNGEVEYDFTVASHMVNEAPADEEEE